MSANPQGSQSRSGVIFAVSISFCDNMYSWFTLSWFKWFLVEVLAKLGLFVLYKEGTLVSQVGKSGLMFFWTSVISLMCGITRRL